MTGEGPASMILNTSIKFWPAEYHSQSAIEAALFLRKEIGDPAKVKSMTIESHDASVDIIGSEPEKWKPETRETADHSLPYITAIALIDGEVTDKQFRAASVSPIRAIWKFLENVKVERNEELSALYPGRGREHCARRSCGWPDADQASRLSAGQREESAEGFSSWKRNSLRSLSRRSAKTARRRLSIMRGSSTKRQTLMN